MKDPEHHKKTSRIRILIKVTGRIQICNTAHSISQEKPPNPLYATGRGNT
jgi:hypothetical protein